MARRGRAAGLGCEPVDQERARLSVARWQQRGWRRVISVWWGHDQRRRSVAGILVRGAGVFREYVNAAPAPPRAERFTAKAQRARREMRDWGFCLGLQR